MKNMIRLSLCFLLLMLLTPMPLALAKGASDKITITGPGLATSIEITDPETLGEFNPWDGQFLDKNRETVTRTPEANVLFQVLYYSKDANGQFRVFYAFKYSPLPSGMRGEIYLPQEKEAGYGMNNETIARPSGWLYASPAWDSLMQRLLKDQQTSSPSIRTIGGSVLAIILIVSTVAHWLRRRRQQTPA